MMITTFLTDEEFDETLARGRQAGRPILRANALNAPANPASGYAEQAWDAIEELLTQARIHGATAAGAAMATAKAAIDTAITQAGSFGQQVTRVIADKMRAWEDAVLAAALARLHPVISVAGQELKLDTVSLSLKVTVSADIKASLQELCKLAADGEIAVEAEYRA